MDFFEHQAAARRRTGLLVAYFCVAVVLIVAIVYVLIRSILLVAGHERVRWPGDLWNTEWFALVAGGTVLLILLGSAYKIFTLRGGGAAVAEMLGGRLVDRATRDSNERRLLNVVEEMAIASGTPVPPVYLMEKERGINAFAAGHTVDNAVVGVTAGAVELLSRDELQGIVAHEYSHILNGDMRLNLRLMGVLHGILMLALTGAILMRSLYFVRVRGRAVAAILAVMALGFVLWVVGYIGVFFGRLIKSAISRQREFLADASAVQFTRNPGGIADALKKIGGRSTGSSLKAARAEEASHLFFGDFRMHRSFAFMSTHPPLAARILRIDPSFDGTFPKIKPPKKEPKKKAAQGVASGERLALDVVMIAATIGAPQPRDAERAASILSDLPEGIEEAARTSLGAVAALFGLLISGDPEVRRAQLEGIEQRAGKPALEETRRLLPLAKKIAREARIPLVELALPALRQLSEKQYKGFRATIVQLAKADKKVTLFEYALQRMLLSHLAPSFEKVSPPTVEHFSIRPLLPDCATLLSALARVGHADDAAEASNAIGKGAQRIAAAFGVSLSPPEEPPGLRKVDAALDRLAAASPAIKKRTLEACAACVEADGQVTVEEGELLRAVADALGCPMPPLGGQG